MECFVIADPKTNEVVDCEGMIWRHEVKEEEIADMKKEVESSTSIQPNNPNLPSMVYNYRG